MALPLLRMHTDFFTSTIKIQVDKRLYLKDPESSELGLKIIKVGTKMIDEMGFEDFTFRKLGQEIGSNEASVYRYFESKYKFIYYLSSWYWGWMMYSLNLCTVNIQSVENRLCNALKLMTEEPKDKLIKDAFDVIRLHRIICFESDKAILNKGVDKMRHEGVFDNYKNFVAMVGEIIREHSPEYKYPRMLVTTVIEGAHFQKFFAKHLPKLTDVIGTELYMTEFYTDMVKKTLKKNDEKDNTI